MTKLGDTFGKPFEFFIEVIDRFLLVFDDM